MVTRWGAAGPLEDVVGAGQAATLRYLDSRGERKITIEPGQSAVINVDLYRPVMPNQVISGIYDLEVTGSGQLEFSFLAIPAGVNPLLAWPLYPCCRLTSICEEHSPRQTVTWQSRQAGSWPG